MIPSLRMDFLEDPMKLKDAVVGWQSRPGGRVVVAPLGTNLPMDFATTGGVWVGLDERSPLEVKTFILIAALHMIVRDGLDPQTVHTALLGVDEYRDACSDDMPGVAKLRARLNED